MKEAEYLIIDKITGMTYQETADKYNIELFNLSRPESTKNTDDVTDRLFPTITHPTTGEVAFKLEDLGNYKINVHKDHNTTKLESLMPNINASEKTQIKGYLKNNSGFPFKNMLPSDVSIRNYFYMDAKGWFPNII